MIVSKKKKCEEEMQRLLEFQILDFKFRLDDTSCLGARAKDILFIWHVILLSNSIQIGEVAFFVWKMQPLVSFDAFVFSGSFNLLTRR